MKLSPESIQIEVGDYPYNPSRKFVKWSLDGETWITYAITEKFAGLLPTLPSETVVDKMNIVMHARHSFNYNWNTKVNGWKRTEPNYDVAQNHDTLWYNTILPEWCKHKETMNRF